MRTPSAVLVSICALVAMLFVTLAYRPISAAAPTVETGEAAPPAPACGGEPCDAVIRGGIAFFERRLAGLDGNGRACSDCHMGTDSFQLSPKDVETRFALLQLARRGNPNADDPLFRPIDADDFRINGENATDFSNLRQNGLIRITFALPPTMRLIDPATNLPSAEASVDVWRSVPSVDNVAITGAGTTNPWPRGPNNFGGYQLDARVGTLQDQALGALTNHAQIQNAVPLQLLDDLASFQRTLFTSHRVRDLADAIRAGAPVVPDADGPLTALEQQGKVVFQRACAQCHGGPDQSTSQAPVPRFIDILTQCPRPVDSATPARFAFAACPPRLARNARTYEITLPGGTRVRRTSSDPGRALLTGVVGGPAPSDDWNKLDVPNLRGISKTAPYFHNNSATTLEDVLDHYTAFFDRLRAVTAPGAPVPAPATTDGVHFDRQPQPEEHDALLAYLRTL